MPPTLTAALQRRREGDARVELESILRELYDVLSRNRRGLKLLDRSAPDLPELGALWFQGARSGLFGLMAEYLERRTRAGLLRPVPDVRAAARLVVETIVFWAVHRHWDPHGEPVTDAAAKNTAIHFIVSALVKGRRP